MAFDLAWLGALFFLALNVTVVLLFVAAIFFVLRMITGVKQLGLPKRIKGLFK